MSELAEIYRIYFDDVYRYLLALSHDAQLAEELTSETFCRAMLRPARLPRGLRYPRLALPDREELLLYRAEAHGPHRAAG